MIDTPSDGLAKKPDDVLRRMLATKPKPKMRPVGVRPKPEPDPDAEVGPN